jgi:hypothetical protein
MIQNINLENFTLLISEGHARYNASARFQCIGKQYATMQVHFTDFNGLRDGGVFTGKLLDYFLEFFNLFCFRN